MTKIAIIGDGFIGNRCLSEWLDAIMIRKIIHTVQDVLDIIDEHQPTAILNAAGVVGKPNVDYCEDHQVETIEGNTILPFIIAQACALRNVYLLHIGSGCIFYGPSPDSKGWRETDYANPTAVYTKAKYAADLILQTLPNVGIARIRMPLDSIPFAGNIIDKLARYNKVADVENSLTIIPDMIPVFRGLLEQKAEGIFHVTNPGSIKHREILELYKKYVDPSYSCEFIKEEDLVGMGLTTKARSTNILQSTNLAKFGLSMRPALEAAEDSMIKYAELKKQAA